MRAQRSAAGFAARAGALSRAGSRWMVPRFSVSTVPVASASGRHAPGEPEGAAPAPEDASGAAEPSSARSTITGS